MFGLGLSSKGLGLTRPTGGSGVVAPVIQLVATRGEIPRGLYGFASALGYNTRISGETWHNVGYGGAKYLRIVFPGFGWGGAAELVPPNDIPIRVGVYFPTAPGTTKRAQVLMGGSAQGTITAGVAQFITDKIDPTTFGWTTFPANAPFQVLTLEDFLIGQQNWSGVGRDVIDSGDRNLYGRTDTMLDGTLTGNFGTAVGSGSGSGGSSNIWSAIKPSAIIGEPVIPMMAIIATGDSRLQSAGGRAGDIPNFRTGGGLANGLYNVNGHHIPWASMAVPATSAAGYAANASRMKTYYQYGTDGFAQHGTNDSGTAAQINASQQAIWAAMKATPGSTITRVYQARVYNRTTSSDNWATIPNQTISQDNATLNALAAGQVGNGTLTGILDPTSQWANPVSPPFITPGNVDKFPATGVAFGGTSDGVHEQDISHQLATSPSYRLWAAQQLGKLATAAPLNTAAPVVLGAPVVGVPLACTKGVWALGATAYVTLAYQWYLGASAIVGATSVTYTPVSGDIGSTLKCVVTATNPIGSASATSNVTGAVTATGTIPSFPAPNVVSGMSAASAIGGTVVGLTATTGQPDPLGGTGATKLTFNSTGNTTRVTIFNTAALVDGQQYTASIDVKAAEYSFLAISAGSGAGAGSDVTNWWYSFNATTGAVDANLASPSLADAIGMIPLGSGWYRAFMTFTQIGARTDSYGMRWYVGATAGVTGSKAVDTNGTSGSGLFVFRAQMAVGPVDY